MTANQKPLEVFLVRVGHWEMRLKAQDGEEAIRLARLLLSLLPDPEVKGLLALLLLTEARRPARADAEGNPVLLEQQDRSLWLQPHIAEGKQLLEAALTQGEISPYLLQAAIAAVHAEAAARHEAPDHAERAALTVNVRTAQSREVLIGAGRDA